MDIDTLYEPKTWNVSWMMRDSTSSQVSTSVSSMVDRHRLMYPAMGRFLELVWQYAAKPITPLHEDVPSFVASPVNMISKSLLGRPMPCG